MYPPTNTQSTTHQLAPNHKTHSPQQTQTNQSRKPNNAKPETNRQIAEPTNQTPTTIKIQHQHRQLQLKNDTTPATNKPITEIPNTENPQTKPIHPQGNQTHQINQNQTTQISNAKQYPNHQQANLNASTLKSITNTRRKAKPPKTTKQNHPKASKPIIQITTKHQQHHNNTYKTLASNYQTTQNPHTNTQPTEL